MICTKRAQAGLSELPPTRTELISWTLNLYPASRGFRLARLICGVVRVAVIRVVSLFSPPNENADGNFSVVEMSRLKTVQSNFYLMGEIKFFNICLFPNLRECQLKSELILMFAVNIVLYLSVDFDLLSSVKFLKIHNYNKFHWN